MIINKFKVNIIEKNKVVTQIVFKSNIKGGDELDDLVFNNDDIEPIITKTTKQKSINLDKKIEIDNIYLLKTDSLLDLKKKIYFLTNIRVEYQYLFYQNINQHIIKINNETIKVPYRFIDIDDLDGGNNNIYNNKNDVKIIKLDEIIFLGDISNEINLINFEKNNIYSQIPSDYKELYYYEYILCYWPYLTQNLSTISIFNKVIDYYDEYNIIKKTQNIDENIFNDIISYCAVEINKRKNEKNTKNAKNASYVDLRKIFDHLSILNELKCVSLYYYDTDINNFIQLIKVDKYDKEKYIDKKILNNLIIIYIKDNKTIKHVININGNQTFLLNINDIYQKNIIYDHILFINSYIKKINKELFYNLDTINLSNISIKNMIININTIYENILQPLIDLDYIIFTKYLANNIVEYYLDHYNSYDIHKLEEINMSNNTYLQPETFIALKSKKTIKIIKNVLNNKVILSGINEKEYEFYKKILNYSIIKEKKSQKNVNNNVGNTKQNVKNLKDKDPLLFDLKKFGTDILYTTLCQKPDQPIMYFEEEIKNLPKHTKDNLVKWWNFTNKKKVYYSCPSKDKPFLNFIVGKHPLNYCLPCCKKTTFDKDVKSKKNTIISECLATYEYKNSKDSKFDSKYIFNYGKSFENGRLIDIVNSKFNKLFATENKMTFSQDNYYGLGVNVEDNMSFINSIYMCTNLNNKSFIQKISDNKYFNLLLGGNIYLYFLNEHELISYINNKQIMNDDFDIDIYTDILYYYYDIYVVIIEDLFDKVILNIKKYIDYDPLKKYIILIKSKIDEKIIYFPIIYTSPSIYFKKREIKESVYSFSNTKIQTILSLENNAEFVINLNKRPEINNDNKSYYEWFNTDNFYIDTIYYNNNENIIMLGIERHGKIKNYNNSFYVPVNIHSYIKETNFNCNYVHITNFINDKNSRNIDKKAINDYIHDLKIKTKDFVSKKYEKYIEITDMLYKHIKIPLYDVFDDSYDNVYFINRYINTHPLSKLDEAKYKKNIEKSFEFIIELQNLYKESSFTKLINNDEKLETYIKNKNLKYGNIIYELLQDKVFKYYIQYIYNEKFLSFNINNNEKLIIN
jgi:hypothetical protein